MAGLALTSFVSKKQSSNKNDMGNEWTYHSSVTAWYEATESRTLYIYYKEGNGVRKYACVFKKYADKDLYQLSLEGYDVVKENPLYNKKSCKDFRLNYRYMAGTDKLWYFNGNFPYMQKN